MWIKISLRNDEEESISFALNTWNNLCSVSGIKLRRPENRFWNIFETWVLLYNFLKGIFKKKIFILVIEF